MPNFPRILIIAGSDSGGGAGIQADIKTVTMLGGYAMTAVTAITAQNTQRVDAIHPIPADMVAKQCHIVIDDIGVDAIKIGMLHDSEVIAAVKSVLSSLNIPIVLDPVMVATSGDCLLDDDALCALKQLMQHATIITPNIPEAEILSGESIKSKDDMLHAAKTIALLGCSKVLIKGGHLQGDELSDLLYDQAEATWFTSKRIESRHTHGTGCTLSSAIATELGKGSALIDAIKIAREYVHEAIITAPEYGQGHGPLNHLHNLRNN